MIQVTFRERKTQCALSDSLNGKWYLSTNVSIIISIPKKSFIIIITFSPKDICIKKYNTEYKVYKLPDSLMSVHNICSQCLHFKGYQGSFPGLKWLWCETDHSASCSAKVKNGYNRRTKRPSLASILDTVYYLMCDKMAYT